VKGHSADTNTESDSKGAISRREALATAARLSIAGTIGHAMVSSGLAAPAPATEQADIAGKAFEATAEGVTAALEGAYRVHRGQRRNHTKGTGALGRFVGAPEGAAYSRSPLFSGEEIEVFARFSLAGGMALEFRLPNGGLHHMTMLNTPMFFAAVPRTFLDRFIALKPDPATDQPDASKVKAFRGHSSR
jgi:catalase